MPVVFRTVITYPPSLDHAGFSGARIIQRNGLVFTLRHQQEFGAILFLPQSMENHILRCPHCGHYGPPLTYLVGKQLRADCKQCKRYLKFLPQNNPPEDFALWFGRYKNKTLKEIATEIGGMSYLQWLAYNEFFNNPRVKSKIRQFLAEGKYV